MRLCFQGPRGSDGAKHLKAEAVHVGEDVVGSFVVAETRSPDALAVNLLAVFQAKVRAEVQAVEGVTDETSSSPDRGSAGWAAPAWCASWCRSGSNPSPHGSCRDRRIRRKTAGSNRSRCRCRPPRTGGSREGRRPARLRRRQAGARRKLDSAYLLQIDLQNLNCVAGHHMLHALALDARGGFDGHDALGMRDRVGRPSRVRLQRVDVSRMRPRADARSGRS